MSQTHSRVRCIDTLSPIAGSTEYVELTVIHINLNIYLFCFRHDGNGNG